MTPLTVAEAVAQDFVDGYPEPISTRFEVSKGDGGGRGLVLAIDAMPTPNHPDSWPILQAAVAAHQDDLAAQGFSFVMLGFSIQKDGDGDLTMGYRHRDWPKFGTLRQPDNPELLIVDDVDDIGTVVGNS